MALPQTCRLFLALWPDDSVRGQLLKHADQWRWSGGCVRYAPADWHVTLHFMGDVPLGQVNAIEASAAVPLQPFTLVLDQPELWPHGLAVLGASVVPEGLHTLHRQLVQALRQLDLAVQTRPYLPHLTLARHAAEATPPAAPAPVRWPVKDFALVLSTGDTTQRYRVLRQYR